MFLSVQMSDLNVFSYMDSTFMHTFDEKIAHIRPLRAIDFEEQESMEAEDEGHQQFHRSPHASPPKLLVCPISHHWCHSQHPLDRVEPSMSLHKTLNCRFCPAQDVVQRDPSPVVDIDMDVDKHYSDEGEDYEEDDDDDDEREAPSEQDTDDAESKGDSGDMDFASSPLHARVLEYPSSSQVTQRDPLTLRSEHEPADEPDDEEREGNLNDEGDHDAGDNSDDYVEDDDNQDAGDEAEDDVEDDEDAGNEAEDDETMEDRDEERHAINQGDEDIEDEIIAPVVTTSTRSTASGEDLPPPSPQEQKAAKRIRSKDRHSRRHTPRVQEPAITESNLESKIAGILSKTLPTMLSSLLQEVIGQSRSQPPQQADQSGPSTVEAHVVSAEPAILPDQVVATQQGGVQGMDVDLVDNASHRVASPPAVDAPEANVSINPRV